MIHLSNNAEHLKKRFFDETWAPIHVGTRDEADVATSNGLSLPRFLLGRNTYHETSRDSNPSLVAMPLSRKLQRVLRAVREKNPGSALGT